MSLKRPQHSSPKTDSKSLGEVILTCLLGLLFLLFVALVIGVIGGILYFYWTFDSYLVDDLWKIPSGPGIGLKLILLVVFLAVLGMIGRIGKRASE